MTETKSPDLLREESLLRAAKIYYELAEEEKREYYIALARRLVQRAVYLKQRSNNGRP